MSQEVRINQTNSDIYAEQIAAQPWSAEAYADKLMDDLFSDIDRLLDGSGKLPTEPVKPEYLSLQPIKIPPVTAPPAVIPPQQQTQQQAEAEVSPTATVPTVTPPSPLPVQPQTSVLPNTSSPSYGYYFEKFLLSATIITGIATAALWFVNTKKPTWLVPQNTTFAPLPEKAAISQVDTLFITYMMRSLEVIDRKSQASKTQGTVSNIPNQPSVPTVNSFPPSSNPAPTVLERVFIPYQTPAYQMPQAPAYQSPQIPAYRPLQVPPPPPKAVMPSVRPTALSPTLPRPKAVVPVTPKTSSPPVVTPQIPKATMPQPASALPTLAPVNAYSNPSVDVVPKHTLLGLLELGERSAALFELGGATQRINVGESIGTSGWTLVTVANQEAVIRRNGEIRSIYVGQKF